MSAQILPHEVLLDDWFVALREVEPGSPAAFFDRDGTLIRNVPYLADSDEVCLERGAVEALSAYRRSGFAIIVITNQSGIARGLVTPAQYASVNQRMINLLGADLVDAIIACPFHPEGVAPWNVPDHPWRKPATGMIDAAASRFGVDVARSVLLGDSVIDIEAGLRAGIGHLIHLGTGHGQRDRAAVENLSRANPGTRISCLASLQSLEVEELAR
ncbi:D-glycero-alpha-D-manno-heptose-1,7-bisphosphate 7-phosphatase [Erythrobacter oryzae]|uniref:D-glycero-alpha-D-manno-heptose-1,7-bisphosphate 7-phosphatase n=1 Tax=Erythrobacter oryzae TaxID=3019556 RepID=UPI0025524AB3|nr:HAD-IIIA family hydrolase [Erythrobacter sp. COR-2]